VLERGSNNIDYEDIGFWNNVEKKCLRKIDNAKVIDFNDFVDVVTLRSTSQDLRDFVQMKHGYPDGYKDSLNFTTSISAYGGNTMRIYETMQVTYTSPQSFTIKNVISIANFLTGAVSIALRLPVVTALAVAMKLVAATSTLIPANRSVVYYKILINWCRCTTINGSKYIYEITEKWSQYDGFEDLSQTVGIQISDTPDTWFTHSSTYFTSYLSQCDTAYNMFLQIGQKP